MPTIRTHGRTLNETVFEAIIVPRSLTGFRSLSLKWVPNRGLGTLVDQGFVSASSFLTGVIMARVIGKEDFGLYVLAITVILLLTNIQTALISIPVTYLLPRSGKNGERSYLGSSLVHSLIFSLIWTALLVLLAAFLSSKTQSSDLPRVLSIVSFPIIPFLLREFIRRMGFACFDLFPPIFVDSLTFTLQVSGLLLLSFVSELTFSSGLIWMGVASGIPSVIFLGLRWRSFKVESRRILVDLARNWLTGKWMFFGDIAQFASLFSYPWLLAWLHGSGSAGIFGACMGPLYLANPIWLSMANYLSPTVAKEYANSGRSGVAKVVKNFTLRFGIIAFFFASFMMVFGEEIVVIFYGEGYGDTQLLVAILAFSQLAQVSTLAIQTGLLAQDRADVVFVSHLIALFFVFSIGFSFVYYFEAIGAAWALVVGNAVASVYRVFGFWREMHKGEMTRS